MQAEDILATIDRAKQKATEIVKSGGLSLYKATRGLNPVSTVVSGIDTVRKVSNLPINTPNYQGTVRSLASDAFKNTQTGLPQTLREGFVIPKRTPTGWTTENKPTIPSTWVANRVVAPAMNVPESAKQVKTGFQKVLGGDIKGGGIEAGIGALGVVGGLSPGPEDLAFSMYDATKARMAGRDRTKGFTGEEYTGLGTAINAGKDTPVANVLNTAELPMLLLAGGLKAKSVKKLSKDDRIRSVLQNEFDVREVIYSVENYDKLAPNIQIRTWEKIKDVADKVIPEVVNSKEMKKTQIYSPAEWMKTTTRFLEDALVQAKNPSMDIGLSTRALGGQKPPDLTALRAIKTPDDFIKQIGSKPYVSGLPPRWFYKNNGVPTEVPSDIADMLSKSNYNPMRQSKVTKTSRNLYHTTPRANLESIAKEGLVTGKTPTIGGGDTQARISSSKKTSFGANEATASYYGGNDAVMLRTKTGYDPGDLELDLLAGGEGTYTTGKNIPPEMLEVKINGKWQPIKPPDPTEALKVEARSGKYKSAEEFGITQGKYKTYHPDDIFGENSIFKNYEPSQADKNYLARISTESLPFDQSISHTKIMPIDILDSQATNAIGYKSNPAKIKEMVKAIKSGEELPPIVVQNTPFTKEGQRLTYGILDGADRLEAYKQAGVKDVKTAIITSTEDFSNPRLKSQLTDLYNQSQLPKTEALKVVEQYTQDGKTGKYWANVGDADKSFGNVKKEAVIDTSKLYKGTSSRKFVLDSNKVSQSDKDLVNYAYDVNNDGMSEYKVSQDIAEKVLKDEGFSGANWISEDDLTPNQYQIWDKSIIKPQSQLPRSGVYPSTLGITPPNLKQLDQPKLPDELQLPPSAKPKNKAFSNVK